METPTQPLPWGDLQGGGAVVWEVAVVVFVVLWLCRAFCRNAGMCCADNRCLRVPGVLLSFLDRLCGVNQVLIGGLLFLLFLCEGAQEGAAGRGPSPPWELSPWCVHQRLV